MLLKTSERKQVSSPIPLILHFPAVLTINILSGDEKMKGKIHIFIINIFKVPPKALNKESMLLTCLHKYQRR